MTLRLTAKLTCSIGRAISTVGYNGGRGIHRAVHQTDAGALPVSRSAGQKAAERNLDASMRFKAFKEQLLHIQAIMESKQRQQQLASDAFAGKQGLSPLNNRLQQDR